MATLLTPQALKAFFDANAGRYKSAVYGIAPLADGYLPSQWLDYQLCTPWQTIPNPITQAPQVLKPFTAQDILGAITTADVLKVVGAPMVSKLTDAILAQDRPNCLSWAQLCAAAGYITAAELAAVEAVLSATIADPSWSATLPISDLEANYVDGMGRTPLRLELALDASGERIAPNGIDFINDAVGRL